MRPFMAVERFRPNAYEQNAPDRKSIAVLVACITITIVAFVLIILRLNDGNWVYALDDPYVHLALAEHLAQGHYGTNTDEFSSPSSSILWPFLLVPWIHLSWAHLVPLVIDALACLLTAYLLLRTLWPVYGPTSSIIAFLLILLSNCFSMIFLGMETSVQILITCAVVSAMIDLAENRPLPRWLGTALIVGPLIRYELLAVSLGAVGLLALRGYYRYIVHAAISIGSIGCFSWYLWEHQGTILPASVTAKLGGFKNSPYDSFNLSAEVVLLALLLFSFRKQPNRLWLIAYIIVVVTAHLLFFPCGLASRYAIYAFVSAAMTLLYYAPLSSFRGFLKTPIGRVTAGIGVLLCTLYYTCCTLSIPNAANVVYSQQAQVYRLLQEAEFPRVAASDIGYVSFRNPSYVFDVYGLGDPNIFRMRRRGDRQWLRIVSSRSVALVMLCPVLFEASAIPEDWIKIGSLITNQPLNGFTIYAPRDAVDIYATSPEAATRITHVIDHWVKGLPKHDVWTWEPKKSL